MKELDDFVSISEKEIMEYLIGLSKEELNIFADTNNIPYKKYYSKNKMVGHLTEYISSTMMFKRIGSI